jgi:hypothetical protein
MTTASSPSASNSLIISGVYQWSLLFLNMLAAPPSVPPSERQEEGDRHTQDRPDKNQDQEVDLHHHFTVLLMS